MSAEGLRNLVYAGLAPRAVLQRPVPHGRRALAPLEGAAALPPDARRAGLSLCAKSSPARAPGAAADARRRSALSRSRVGHRPAKNVSPRATARAATRPLGGPAGLRSSDSARGPVGARWNAWSNASAGGAAAGGGVEAGARDRGGVERSILRRGRAAR